MNQGSDHNSKADDDPPYVNPDVTLPDPCPLTVEHVRAWFREAAPRWEQPTDEAVKTLHAMLHLSWLQRSEAPPRNRPNPVEELLLRIQRTIAILRRDMMLAALVVSSFTKSEKSVEGAEKEAVEFAEMVLKAARRLLAKDVALLARLSDYDHGLIRFVGLPRQECGGMPPLVVHFVEEAWRSAGRTKLGPKPDSPLVKALVPALAWVEGRERTPEAIARALSRERARRKQAPTLSTDEVAAAAYLSRVQRVQKIVGPTGVTRGRASRVIRQSPRVPSSSSLSKRTRTDKDERSSES